MGTKVHSLPTVSPSSPVGMHLELSEMHKKQHEIPNPMYTSDLSEASSGDLSTRSYCCLSSKRDLSSDDEGHIDGTTTTSTSSNLSVSDSSPEPSPKSSRHETMVVSQLTNSSEVLHSEAPPIKRGFELERALSDLTKGRISIDSSRNSNASPALVRNSSEKSNQSPRLENKKKFLTRLDSWRHLSRHPGAPAKTSQIAAGASQSTGEIATSISSQATSSSSTSAPILKPHAKAKFASWLNRSKSNLSSSSDSLKLTDKKLPSGTLSMIERGIELLAEHATIKINPVSSSTAMRSIDLGAVETPLLENHLELFRAPQLLAFTDMLQKLKLKLLSTYHDEKSMKLIKKKFDVLESYCSTPKAFHDFYKGSKNGRKIIDKMLFYSANVGKAPINMLGEKFSSYRTHAHNHAEPQILRSIEWDPSIPFIQENNVPLWVRTRTEKHNIDDSDKEKLFELDLNLIDEGRIRRSINKAGRIQISVKDRPDMSLDFNPFQVSSEAEEAYFKDLSSQILEMVKKSIGTGSHDELAESYKTSMLKTMNIEAGRIADLLFRKNFPDIIHYFEFAPDLTANTEYAVVMHNLHQFEVSMTKSLLLCPKRTPGQWGADKEHPTASISYTLTLTVDPLKEGVGLGIVDGKFNVSRFKFNKQDPEVLKHLFDLLTKDVSQSIVQTEIEADSQSMSTISLSSSYTPSNSEASQSDE